MKIIILFLLFLVTLSAKQLYTNALIKETSPYLQQHAHNPVQWYPWGKEAFEKAKKEKKLIFLSIGYSTCHWCHVMEEESFENKAIAKLLNDNYVAIKVDREEYTQLDKKYQQWFMSIYGKRGGWPLSIFMSPDAEVFHLATYIPAEEGYGSKGMFNMLPSFVKMYQNNYEKFTSLSAKYKKLRLEGNKRKVLKEHLTLNVVSTYMKEVKKQFDAKNGGFAKRPKFPEASKIELLLDIYKLYADQDALHMAELTLKKMAEGGIYDQIGGGFFRYTTDVEWQIPHFEKMLYTNAELIAVYTKAYLITHNALYKNVVLQSIEQMQKHFMKEGLYFSASDADSSGEEGGYFIFNYVEIKDALIQKGMQTQNVDEVLAYLGIEEDGNIDGELSQLHVTSNEIPLKLKEVKAYLKNLSAKRVFPFIDKKVITSWNAMMIKALFIASSIDSKYKEIAQEELAKLLKLMRRGDTLYHQVFFHKEPSQKALLEDYAFLISALIEGYEKTYQYKYLELIKELSKEVKEKFYKNNEWYLSDDGIDALADYDDKYYTAALSLMLENFVKVASLSENLDYYTLVKQTLKRDGKILQDNPQGASKLLHTFIRVETGDVSIKSKLENLLQMKDKIEKIKYPFILSKEEKSDIYLACRVNSCFAYDKNITKLIEKIEKAVK